MKIQLDSDNTANTFDKPNLNSNPEVKGSEEVRQMLRSGIKAAQAGNRAEARNFLLNVTEAEPDNEDAWLWLASISEYPEELLIFLNNVLKINPENQKAVEWARATRALLSKTFVERGIKASEDDQKEFAKQCFLQAIVHDDQNELAWLWLASISDTDEEKNSYLQRVLRINPENETALATLKKNKVKIAKNLLEQANEDAAGGNVNEALEHLRESLKQSPDLEEAWILKSHLTTSLSEKLECFEKVLELNPDNPIAQAGVASLKAIVGRSKPSTTGESAPEEAVEKPGPAKELLADPNGELLELKPAETVEKKKDQAPSAVPPEPKKPEAEAKPAPAATDAPREPKEEPRAAAPAEEPAAAPAEEPAAAPAEEPAADPAEKPAPEADKSQKPSADANEENRVNDEFEDLRQEFAAEAGAIIDEIEETPAVNGDRPPAAAPKNRSAVKECPFCRAENSQQEIVCQCCQAMLTVTDIEMLLAHTGADEKILERAVARLEDDQNARQLSVEELVNLGIAQINLRNLRKGYEHLQQAVQLNPNDVVLHSQVNSLAIRISEIEQKKSIQDSMPKNKTILVVDDSATVRKLISSKLEKCGHEVICAVDGKDALEKINEVVPDLILLDITMPRMDGYQVCKLIRGNEVTKDVPVVMISGKDGFFDKVRGRMAGTSGYITKPFGPETLMKTVDTYLV